MFTIKENIRVYCVKWRHLLVSFPTTNVASGPGGWMTTNALSSRLNDEIPPKYTDCNHMFADGAILEVIVMQGSRYCAGVSKQGQKPK